MSRTFPFRYSINSAGGRVAAVLLLAISPVLSLAIQHSDEWVKYTSKEGRYTVLLPSQPTVGTQEAATASGEKFTQYKATVSSGKSIYMIGYFDYGPSTLFDFDMARDGMMEQVKATLVSERSISLGSASGREVKLRVKVEGDDYSIVARFYDVGGRVYILQFITPKSSDTQSEASASRYFESFQVMP